VFNILFSAVEARLPSVTRGGWWVRSAKGGDLCSLAWLGGLESARGDGESY
jgi:hypothetical protein